MTEFYPDLDEIYEEKQDEQMKEVSTDIEIPIPVPYSTNSYLRKLEMTSLYGKIGKDLPEARLQVAKNSENVDYLLVVTYIDKDGYKTNVRQKIIAKQIQLAIIKASAWFYSNYGKEAKDITYFLVERVDVDYLLPQP